MSVTALRDLIELVRAPAALSVPGDVLAGAAAGRALGGRTLGLACSSICLYWAGMAANDWADRHLDAVERPERPIPSGRVPPGTALAVASGLTVAGLALAALTGGRRSLTVAAPLAAAIWTYDLAAKNTPAGPLAMAVCRALDVLLGATSSHSPAATPAEAQPTAQPTAQSTGLSTALFSALPAALTVAAHTYLLTALSRDETSGGTRGTPATTLAGTVALAVTTALQPTSRPPAAPPSDRTPSPSDAATQAALALWYATQFAPSQARAVTEPSADRVRAAVTAGIVSLPALQGALVARAGAPRIGLALAAAVPLARRLARKVSPT